MNFFSQTDSHHIKAAQGWLGLGNHLEANDELEKITRKNRTHPDVLNVRWEIYAKSGRWEECVDMAEAVGRGLAK